MKELDSYFLFFIQRWEKENFGEKPQQYMSDNSRQPGDTSLSEYSTIRERYKNELDSKLTFEKRTDPKSELIEEEEEEEEVEEEIDEEEEEEEVQPGSSLMTNEGKETVRKYFERTSADVYTIPEEEDEMSSPTCGDGVTSLRRRGESPGHLFPPPIAWIALRSVYVVSSFHCKWFRATIIKQR